jgi:uncharacterized repeat protein (TIGR02543 family)
MWRLNGGKQGEEETLLAEFSNSESQTVVLETGTWRFTLTGYKEDNVILTGNIAEQTIGEGSNTLSFTVTPLLEGEGDVNIAIELPAGSGITAARVFIDGVELEASFAPIDDKIVFTATYTAGVYLFSVRLYKEDVLYGVVSEIVYVWAHLQSAKTYTLAQENLNLTYIITYHSEGGTDFGYYRYTDAIPLTTPAPREGYAFKGWYDNEELSGSAVSAIPTGSTGDKDFYARWTEFVDTPSNLSLTAALTWIGNNAEEGGAYTITLKDQEFIEPKTLSYTVGNVHITINGGNMERIVSLFTSSGSLFIVESGVTLTLGNNVTLQGVNDNSAELVRVNSGGSLVMENGSKIIGNSNTSGYGGGVSVSYGTFIQSGGTISDNSTSYYYGYGGGVYVYSGTFTQSGGTISSNSVSGSYESYGGGVYVDGGTFTMNGGEISDNTASNYGGGVYVNSGTFAQSGGEISGNTASRGGGAYISSSGTFTKKAGGVIYGSNAGDGLKNTATEGYTYGHAVYIDSSPIKIRNATADSGVALDGATSGATGGWETSISSNLSLAQALTWINNNAVEGGSYTYTLGADEAIVPTTLSYNGKNVSVTFTGGTTERTVSLITTGSLFTIDAGVSLTLGNNVTLQGRSSNTASLVRVNSGGSLVMENDSKITGNTNSSGNGGGVYVYSGTFTQNGGAISDNSSSSYGGGVYVYYSGTFTQSGGTISDNSAYTGGGVYVYYNSSTFMMSGGAISGNSSSYGGGGVYVSSNGTFTQSGGEISDNSADVGGGVVVDSGGTFTQSGGTISDNSAYTGGGVYLYSGGTFTKQAGGIIYGSNAEAGLKNTATHGDNYGHAVYVNSSKKRDSTADSSVTLDSGTADGWE